MNKRFFVVMMICIIVVSMLVGACGTKPTAQEIEKNVYQSVCWDLEGTIGPDGKCVLPQATSEEVYEEEIRSSLNVESYSWHPDKQCLESAKERGFPLSTAVWTCKPVQDYQLPARVMIPGERVRFGTLTFENEWRVWILFNFVVPTQANYSFEYIGREQLLLVDPFIIGTEHSSVTGKEFKLCFDTAGECTPPVTVYLRYTY